MHRLLKHELFKKYYKIFTPIFVTLLVLIGMMVFVPPLYAYKAAEQAIEDKNVSIDKDLTREINGDFWDGLWHPKYAVFGEIENAATTDFVVLEREHWLWWEAKDITTEYMFVDEGLSDEEKDQKIEDNKEAMEEAVENGSLSEGSGFNSELSEIIKNAIEKEEAQNAPGVVIQEISDESGENNISVVNSEVKFGNVLHLNNEQIARNVYSLDFDLEGKNLYYSKYDIDENAELEITKSTGKVYKYNLESGVKELVYDFGEGLSVNFKANQDKLFFVTENGEAGTIDLQAKERVNIDITNYLKTENEYGTDVQIIPATVLDISEKSAMLKITQTNPETETKYLRINLETLEITES